MIRCHLLRALLVLMALGWPIFASAQNAKGELFRGMTEDEVIETLGQPTSEMGRTGKKVLIYEGGSMELRDGRLYSAEGLAMEYMAPDGKSQFAYTTLGGWTLNGQPIDAEFRFTAAPVNAPPPPDTGVKFYRPGEENDPPAPNVVVGSPPRPTPEPAPAPTPVVQAPPPPPPPVAEEVEATMPEDTEEELSADYSEFDEWDEEYLYDDYTPSAMDTAISITIQFIVGFILTVIIIKIAFEQKGFPVLMPQLLLVSGIQAVVSLCLDLAMASVGYDSMFLEQGVEFISLSVLIYLITDVQTSITAMSIALIARGVTFVVNYLIALTVLMGFGYMIG